MYGRLQAPFCSISLPFTFVTFLVFCSWWYPESEEGLKLMQHLLAWHAPSSLLFTLQTLLHTAVQSVLRSAHFMDSFCVLRGVEARSHLMCSSSSCEVILAHQFSLICHVYFCVSLVLMAIRDHLTFLCVLCPVVAFIDGLLLFSSFFLPHIPLMADGNCCWRLSAQFQSPQPHHPLTIPVCCSCYNPFNQPELLYFISSPLVCFGLWGRGWRGEGGVKFPLWSQSRCGSEEGWGRFCRCAWSPGSSSLTSTEHDSSQMQLTLLESLKPSPLAVCPVEHSATSQGLGYGKANPINNKVTSNLINKQNWKNAEWVWKSGWNVRQGFLVIFTEASFISWISEVRERVIKGTTVKTAVTNTSQEGNLGFQNGKPLPVQRDLDDRITGGLVVYWFIALISKC